MKQITKFGLVLFLFFICINLAYAAPQIPFQIYGSITPILPDGLIIGFEVNDIEIASEAIDSSKYGYEPLVFITKDDPETGQTDGWKANETIVIYIKNIKVDEFVPQTDIIERDISLSDDLYNQIMGITPGSTPSGTSSSRGGSSGPSSRGFVPINNITVILSETEQDFQVRFRYGINFLFGGKTYSIYVSRMTYRNIELDLDSKNLDIGENQETIVDLNNDGRDDLAVRYKGVRGNVGILSLKLLSQPAPVVTPPPPQPVQPPAEVPAPTPAPEPSSNLWLIILLIIIAVILIGGSIGWLFYERNKTHAAYKEEQKQEKLKQESLKNLGNYVKQTMAGGYTKEQVKQALKKEGWSDSIIDQTMEKNSIK